MTSRVGRSVCGFVLATVLLASGSTNAQANEPASDAESVARAVAAVSPAEHIATAPSVTSSGIDVTTAVGSVVLPQSSSGQVVIDATSGAIPFAVDLPDVGAAQAKVAKDGTVVYSTGEAVDLAIQADGTSARIHTVVNDPSTPHEFAYTFAGATPVLQEDGSVILTAESNGISVDFALVSAPWAYDTAGTAIPTIYRIEGDTVVQELDLTGDVTYPVVADPWVQADCGTVTCTVRFDRSTTRNVRDGAGYSAIASGVVAALSGGILLPAAAVIGAFLGMNSTTAGRYYENGNCFGIKVVPGGAINPWWPTQVARNTYNCR